ncbi:UNVERIFIED_CONTAM: hypothetical protein FKN15_035952 [Acipenser sinensis]
MDEDRLLMASLKEEESYEDEDVNLDRGDNTEKAIEHYTSEKIKRAVEDIEHTPSATLDLSRKGLQHVDDLFNISRIENLYLEGNEISSLPDHFFSELSNLVWLDLRNNKISCLPPGIGQHRCLKTLLLEGNPIKELPIELAMPPIEKLKLTGLVKSSLELSEEWPNDEEMKRFEKLRMEMVQADEADMGDTDQSFQLVPSIDRAVLTSKGARKTIIARLPKSSLIWILFGLFYVSLFLYLYNISKVKEYNHITQNFHLIIYNQGRTTAQERRLLALKDLKEKQALIEQRRKDQELLKEWREHSKCMQEKGEMESRQGGTALAKSDEVLKNAPYATDPDFYRMLDSRECIKQGSREEHVRVKKLLTRKSLKEIEDARAARDRELEYRIRAHIQMMQERRRKSKGTVQEEIDATRTEMEAAQKLQSEVVQRKLERDIPLEYRFTAFTGEQSS